MRLKITRKERANLKRVLKRFQESKTDEQIFYDLCFCICAPQCPFKQNIIAIQNLTMADFYGSKLKINEIRGSIKETRFYNQKAKRLKEAKKKFDEILYAINIWRYNREGIETLSGEDNFDSYDLRNWLVKNVKGLGMKTASHFIRNLGDTSLAIIDTHIIKFLKTQTVDCVRISMQPCNKTDYLFMEKRFKKIAKRNKLTTAELDALVWKRYSGTDWDEFIY